MEVLQLGEPPPQVGRPVVQAGGKSRSLLESVLFDAMLQRAGFVAAQPRQQDDHQREQREGNTARTAEGPSPP